MARSKSRKSGRRVKFIPRAERCNRLGFGSYAEYLQSEHWKQFRRAWWKSGRRRNCRVCNLLLDRQMVLHHVTYERLGAECFDDVMPLCKRCHEVIHRIHRERNLPLAQHKEAIRLAREVVGVVTEADEWNRLRREARRQEKQRRREEARNRKPREVVRVRVSRLGEKPILSERQIYIKRMLLTGFHAANIARARGWERRLVDAEVAWIKDFVLTSDEIRILNLGHLVAPH